MLEGFSILLQPGVATQFIFSFTMTRISILVHAVHGIRLWQNYFYAQYNQIFNKLTSYRKIFCLVTL